VLLLAGHPLKSSPQIGFDPFVAGSQEGEHEMNWNRIHGSWKLCRGTLRVKWGQYIHNDAQIMRGKRQQLLGQIQSRYGVSGNDVEAQVDNFLQALCRTVLEHQNTSTTRHQPEHRGDKS
jgi:uncharacterized protein YjbJ (UPF0337 family)